MALGSERSLLMGDPLKRWGVRLVGDIHFGRVLRFMYLRQALTKLCPRPDRILDAGCGRGEIAHYLARRFPYAHVVGVDMSESDLATARQARAAACLTNLTFIRHDLQFPLCIANFDLAISSEVLQYVPDDDAVLANLHHAIRPGGVCLLHLMHVTGAYQQIGVRRALDLPVGHYSSAGQLRAGYDESTIEIKLKHAGFERVVVKPTFGQVGMFAHSLFEAGRDWPTILYLILFPFLILLGYADIHMPKKEGGALLAVAWKA